MKLIYLPFDCKRIPDGFCPIEAYSDGAAVIVLLASVDEEDNHDCDVNGCGTLNHVMRFPLKETV